MESVLLRLLSLYVLLFSATGQNSDIVAPSLGAVIRGSLPDSAFSASSELDGLSSASNARLKRRGSSWLPSAGDTSPWLQVDLGEISDVYALITQGKQEGRAQFTKAYSVSSSLDGQTYDFITENGVNKVFTANVNKNAPVQNDLDSPIKARFVRIYPTECSRTTPCALRVDVLGYPECKDDFERFGPSCYIHLTTLGDFSQQQAACLAFGANLASVSSEEENDFIAQLSDSVRSWIGGKLDPSTGTYMWVDGSDWSFEKWRKREPNNWGNGESCVETNFVRPSLWNDRFCKQDKPAICKRT